MSNVACTQTTLQQLASAQNIASNGVLIQALDEMLELIGRLGACTRWKSGIEEIGRH